jgi:DNA-binding XRE family transcriptional regulator
VLSGDDSAICCVSYGLQGEPYEVCHIDVSRSIDENFTVSLPKLTGNLFRAGRALAGLTRDDLANRAGLSRDVLRSWEISGESIVPAQYQMLCRTVSALEAEGIRFSDGRVPPVCQSGVQIIEREVIVGREVF